MEAVARATLARVDTLVARFGAGRFDTLYVGGGTPSVLDRDTLRFLLRGLARRAAAGAEWTVEANPESIDEDFLSILEDEGVTRISIGVQTLDEGRLAELGRPAGAAAAMASLRLAARRRLRLSADLIAGFSREKGLAEEARILAEEGCGHLSIYDLTLEEGTSLERRHRRGDFGMEDEDRASDEREAAEEGLAALGLRRYEVSNYAIPGMESAHNLVYWRMGSWLGAGPGASGTLVRRPGDGAPRRPGDMTPRLGIDGGALRIDEVRSPEAYAAGDAAATAVESEVNPFDSAFEVMMMAFRTTEGLDAGAFAARFGVEAEALVGQSLAKWGARLRREGSRLALDGRGLDLLNSFLSDCLAEMEGTFPRSGSLDPASRELRGTAPRD